MTGRVKKGAAQQGSSTTEPVAGGSSNPIEPRDDGTAVESAALRAKLDEHSQVLDSLKDLPAMMASFQAQLSAFQSHDVTSEEEGELENESEDNLAALLTDLNGQPSINNQKYGESESLMDILVDSEQTVEYGDPITEKVAESFSKCVTRPLSKETVEKLKNSMKPPDNCKYIGVPRVNNEIWNVIPNPSRSSDFKLQQLQLSLSQGLTAFARIADCVTKNSQSMSPDVATEILKLAVNGGNLLGTGFQELSTKRRHEIKPSLNQEYAGICSTRFPVTEYLFGDNLSENLKESKTTSNLGKKVGGRYKPRIHPYNANRTTSSFTTHRPNLNYNRPPPNQTKFRRGGPSQFRHQAPFPPRNQQKF